MGLYMSSLQTYGLLIGFYGAVQIATRSFALAEVKGVFGPFRCQFKGLLKPFGRIAIAALSI